MLELLFLVINQDLMMIEWRRLHSQGSYRKGQSDTSLLDLLHLVPQDLFFPRMIHWFQYVRTRRQALVARKSFVRRSAHEPIVLYIRTYCYEPKAQAEAVDKLKEIAIKHKYVMGKWCNLSLWLLFLVMNSADR